jgi:hypothetical protein
MLAEEANNYYDKYEKILANSEYLQNITEDIIYNAYQPAVRKNHSREFNNFS